MSRLGNLEDVSHLSGLLLAGEGAFMLCPVSVGFQKSGCDALLRRPSVPAEEGPGRGAASGTAPFSFPAVQTATTTQSLLGFYVPGTVPSDLHTLMI